MTAAPIPLRRLVTGGARMGWCSICRKRVHVGYSGTLHSSLRHPRVTKRPKGAAR